jgi:energy-coupling factor transport system ATP-binding protein
MAIQFENVTYRYPMRGITGSTAGLDEVCLKLAEGRFTAILGTPGSGKSTLLQHFNGLLLPGRGRIRIYDCELGAQRPDPKQLQGLRRRVGLVLQYPEHQLFEDTLAKDLAFGPMNFGASREEALAAAREALVLVGLNESFMESNPFGLSGGQQRKAAIASVLAANPDLLVLDEPTASLDQSSRKELLGMLAGLCRIQNRTVVVVTHRLEEVLPYADDLVVMQNGRIACQGELQTLLLRHPERLEEAGIELPSSVRLLQQASETLGAPMPDHLPDVIELANYIQHALAMNAPN